VLACGGAMGVPCEKRTRTRMGIGAGFVAAGRADEDGNAARRGRVVHAFGHGVRRFSRENAVAIQIGLLVRDTRRTVGFCVRTAGLLACGSSPLPPSRNSPVASGAGSSLTVAGTAAALESRDPAPHSLLASSCWGR